MLKFFLVTGIVYQVFASALINGGFEEGLRGWEFGQAFVVSDAKFG